MIKFEAFDTIEGVTVFADSKQYDTFYLLPEQPTFRVDGNGEPIFTFLKYQLPVDRPDGKKGGGYVVFDTEFTVPSETLKTITEKLQEHVNAAAKKNNITPAPAVKIATISFTTGTARLNIMKNEALVERVFDAGKPSLFGKNIATFSIELTPEGTTVFEQALQGKGGFVSVIYELFYDAQLPPVTITGSFNASAFYNFVQTIDVEERWCAADDYHEALSESLYRSESVYLHVDKGSTQVDAKTLQAVEDWARQSMDAAVERLMLKEMAFENPEDARKWYAEKDFEHVKKTVNKSQVSNYNFNYKSEQYISKNVNPNGTLPNITNIITKEGKAVKWEDHFKLIKADDEFFRQIHVAAAVNASFEELPIHSIELKVSYNGKPMDVIGSPIEGEFRFTSPDEVARFAAFKEKDKETYKYSYQVNYKGSAKTYKSPEIETDISEGQLTVNVDDMGILLVDILPGDINFNEIQQVQVFVQYEDKPNGVNLIERQFIMTKDNPVHNVKQVIFAPRDKQIKYKCKFFMKNNKEYTEDWKGSDSNKLYINDPFQGERTVRLIALSDFTTDVASIISDFKYQDKANKYEQTASIVLNERQTFFDWVFPVIDPSEEVGEVSYKGTILYKNGTVKDIQPTVDNAGSILLGEKNPDIFRVQVFADLIDFDMTVKMVKLSLKYKDDKNSILQRKDFVFGANKPMEQLWSFKLADKTKLDYEWTATYYMLDNSRLTTTSVSTEDEILMLETPEQAARGFMPASMSAKRELVKKRAAKRG